MRKTQLFASVAATLILATGFGMWVASTQARVAVAKVEVSIHFGNNAARRRFAHCA